MISTLSVRCLRPSSRRTQILYPAMPIKWTFTAERRALHVEAHAHLFHPPHLTPLPSLGWTLQDGGWVKEEKMSASLRETDEPSAWFRCLSILGCAAAQLSGQTVMASRFQLERLEPHSLRHLGSAAVFHTCELASLKQASAGCGHCSRLRQCWRTTFHLVQ